MSLISIKNFISPFRNTVHLVTIILITVLFVLFRLQGGGVGISSPNTSREILIERDPPRLDSLIQRDTAPQAAPRVPESGQIDISEDEEDLLKEMIGKKPLAEAPAKPARKNNDGSDGGLDEIEKSLGMR